MKKGNDLWLGWLQVIYEADFSEKETNFSRRGRRIETTKVLAVDLIKKEKSRLIIHLQIIIKWKICISSEENGDGRRDVAGNIDFVLTNVDIQRSLYRDDQRLADPRQILPVIRVSTWKSIYSFAVLLSFVDSSIGRRRDRQESTDLPWIFRQLPLVLIQLLTIVANFGNASSRSHFSK